MSEEMNPERLQQVVRSIAIEKTAPVKEQVEMAVVVLQEAFHNDVTVENFSWNNVKLSDEVKKRYIGRLLDRSEFEKNVVIESAAVYNRVQENELCNGRQDGVSEGQNQGSATAFNACPGVRRAIEVIFETAFEYGLEAIFKQLIKVFPQSYEALTHPVGITEGSLEEKVVDEVVNAENGLKKKGLALLKRAYRHLAVCLVVHRHKCECTNEINAASMATYTSCTTCLWAEAYGFIPTSFTEEVDDQPEKTAHFDLLDGDDVEALDRVSHMASIRKAYGAGPTSLDEKKYVDQSGRLIEGRSFKIEMQENDYSGKIDVRDMLGKMCNEIPDTMLQQEGERVKRLENGLPGYYLKWRQFFKNDPTRYYSRRIPMERNVSDWLSVGCVDDLRIRNRYGIDEQTALWCIGALCVLVEKMRHIQQWTENPTYSIKVLDFVQLVRILFGDALISHPACIEVLVNKCPFLDPRSKNANLIDSLSDSSKIRARVYVDMNQVDKMSPQGRWKQPVILLQAARDVVEKHLVSKKWKYRENGGLDERSVVQLMCADVFKMLEKVMDESVQFPRRCVPMYIPLAAARSMTQGILSDVWEELDFYPVKWNEETFSIYTGRSIGYVGKPFEVRKAQASSEINECLRRLTDFYDPREGNVIKMTGKKGNVANQWRYVVLKGPIKIQGDMASREYEIGLKSSREIDNILFREYGSLCNKESRINICNDILTKRVILGSIVKGDGHVNPEEVPTAVVTKEYKEATWARLGLQTAIMYAVDTEMAEVESRATVNTKWSVEGLPACSKAQEYGLNPADGIAEVSESEAESVKPTNLTALRAEASKLGKEMGREAKSPTVSLASEASNFASSEVSRATLQYFITNLRSPVTPETGSQEKSGSKSEEMTRGDVNEWWDIAIALFNQVERESLESSEEPEVEALTVAEVVAKGTELREAGVSPLDVKDAAARIVLKDQNQSMTLCEWDKIFFGLHSWQQALGGVGNERTNRQYDPVVLNIGYMTKSTEAWKEKQEKEFHPKLLLVHPARRPVVSAVKILMDGLRERGLLWWIGQVEKQDQHGNITLSLVRLCNTEANEEGSERSTQSLESHILYLKGRQNLDLVIPARALEWLMNYNSFARYMQIVPTKAKLWVKIDVFFDPVYLNGDEWQFFVTNLAIPNYSQVQLEGEPWEETIKRSGYSAAEKFGEKVLTWRRSDEEVPASMFSYKERIRLIRKSDPKDQREIGSEWPGSNVVTVKFSDYQDRRSWLHCDKWSVFPAMWLDQLCPMGRIGSAAMQQMNEKTRGIFHSEHIRTQEGVKLWEKGMYPEWKSQWEDFTGKMKWDGTDLEHKMESKDELVVSFEVSQLYVANLISVARDSWPGMARQKLTEKLKKNPTGSEHLNETFLWNQKDAPDMVRDKCVTPVLETAKVKIPKPERVCCGNVIIKPNQDSSLMDEMTQKARKSQVSLIRQPDPDEKTEEKGKQSGGKWNSYAVYSEGKQQSFEEQVGKMSEAEMEQMAKLLAQRKNKSEANDDVCVNGKACPNGAWQSSQQNANESNGWQNWSESDWNQARNLQKAHDEQREEENDAKDQPNEPSESSTGRKRSGEKVPVASAASTVWGRKKYVTESRD